MNVFGGGGACRSRSLRGPRGFRGKDGTMDDFCTWMPKTLLNNLQRNDEICCFFIDDPTRDLQHDQKDITKWLSRSAKSFHLIAEKPAQNTIELVNERYAIEFKNSRYFNDELDFFAKNSRSYGFFPITFRISGDDEQTLISNWDVGSSCFSEVSATSMQIHIYGMEDGQMITVTIQHSCTNWTTLFIDYVTGGSQTECTAIINNDVAETFTFDSDEGNLSGFSVGSRYNDTRFLHGDIDSIEMYYSLNLQKRLPDNVRYLIIENQIIT